MNELSKLFNDAAQVIGSGVLVIWGLILLYAGSIIVSGWVRALGGRTAPRLAPTHPKPEPPPAPPQKRFTPTPHVDHPLPGRLYVQNPVSGAWDPIGEVLSIEIGSTGAAEQPAQKPKELTDPDRVAMQRRAK